MTPASQTRFRPAPKLSFNAFVESVEAQPDQAALGLTFLEPEKPPLLYGRMGQKSSDLKPGETHLAKWRLDSMKARSVVEKAVKWFSGNSPASDRPEVHKAIEMLKAVLAVSDDARDPGLRAGELKAALRTLANAERFVLEAMPLSDAEAPIADALKGPLESLLAKPRVARNPALQARLIALAGCLSGHLAHPSHALDLGGFHADDVGRFADAGGMEAFLAERQQRYPAITALVLPVEMEDVHSWVAQMPGVTDLVVPRWNGSHLDVSHLPTLESMELDRPIRQARPIEILTARGCVVKVVSEVDPDGDLPQGVVATLAQVDPRQAQQGARHGALLRLRLQIDEHLAAIDRQFEVPLGRTRLASDLRHQVLLEAIDWQRASAAERQGPAFDGLRRFENDPHWQRLAAEAARLFPAGLPTESDGELSRTGLQRDVFEQDPV